MALYGDATYYYKKIGMSNSFYGDAYTRLANLYFQRGNVVKAIQICDQAIEKMKLDPRSMEKEIGGPLCFKGNLLQQIGDFEKARKTFEQVRDDSYAKLSELSCLYETSVSFRERRR